MFDHVWLVVWNMNFIFPYILLHIITYIYIYMYIYIYLLGIVTLTDFHIFQRGRCTTNQLEVYAQPVINM